MRKLLIFIILPATALSTACSTVTDAIPDALDRAPLVYRPIIEQGNVVTQEQVNEVEPGMSKRQIRFLLGSPMLTDVFHADRWDYAYTTGVGSKPDEIKRLTVYFEDDRLVRISGDMRPQPEEQRTEKKKEVVVTVPDWEPEEKTVFGRLMNAVGLGSNGE